MKNYRVIVELPELPASQAQHEYAVKASKLHVAVNRALSAVEQKPQVKGRRITRAQITVYVGATIRPADLNQ